MATVTVTFTITELCLRTGLSEEELTEIVGLGMIEPHQPQADTWLFDDSAVTIVHRAVRLRNELELDWPGIAVALTLLDENARLTRENRLLHITDMAWKRVKHPSEIVNVGDEITVKVLKFDRERTRVSLGLKQLGEDPWVAIAKRYPEGTKLTGRVTNLTDYGCFVEIEEGVEGLVHVSEMDWTNKNIHPSKVVNVGDVVEVMVLDIDEERRRISLGLKQCKSNPWQQFAETHNKGDRVEGKIKSITDFGIFIGLDGGIDGLVHLSDISWNVAGEEAVREYKKGDEIAAVVLQVDAERERISLGVKQLAEDPFNNYVALNKKGAIVVGKVTAVDAKGATVELADGVEGYLRASEASRDRVEDATLVLSVGDEVEAKFTGVDRKNRVVSLSVRAKDEAEEKDAIATVNKQEDANFSNNAMAEAFKAAKGE